MYRIKGNFLITQRRSKATLPLKYKRKRTANKIAFIDGNNSTGALKPSHKHKKKMQIVIRIVLTRKAFYHYANEIAKMFLHITDAWVILVCFRLQIQSCTLNVFNKCRMQRHRFPLDNAWANRIRNDNNFVFINKKKITKLQSQFNEIVINPFKDVFLKFIERLTWFRRCD